MYKSDNLPIFPCFKRSKYRSYLSCLAGSLANGWNPAWRQLEVWGNCVVWILNGLISNLSCSMVITSCFGSTATILLSGEVLLPTAGVNVWFLSVVEIDSDWRSQFAIWFLDISFNVKVFWLLSESFASRFASSFLSRSKTEPVRRIV